MKNVKQSVKVAILVIIVFIVTNGSSIFTSQSSSSFDFESRISSLLHENGELRASLKKASDRLYEIESKMQKVNETDNRIYSQLLGIPVDTLDFNGYKNDSIDYYSVQYDSIMNNIDRKSLYISELVSYQLTKLNEKSEIIKNNKNVLNYYPTISPIKTKDFINITSGFGWRNHPIYHKPIFHEGIDISAKRGTQVFASASGRVEGLLYSRFGYGNRVVIKHSYGYETLYAHLGSINVKKGQYVKKGQLIGTVGSTGLSTGPHLHYEVHLNGKFVDPLGYFYSYLIDDLIANNDIK